MKYKNLLNERQIRTISKGWYFVREILARWKINVRYLVKVMLLYKNKVLRNHFVGFFTVCLQTTYDNIFLYELYNNKRCYGQKSIKGRMHIEVKGFRLGWVALLTINVMYIHIYTGLLYIICRSTYIILLGATRNLKN